MKKIIVAIDGPAGAGKSTVAKMTAAKLNYVYIDTGAMYRTVTLEVINKGIDTADEDKIIDIASSLDISLEYINNKIVVKANGADITEAIRTPEVSKWVAEVSQISGVRQAMVKIQRRMAKNGGAVLDGRDIASNVLPDADVKIFLTASINERAKRRWLELKAKGYNIELAELDAEIETRDRMDSERAIAPLIKAADAVLIDTTALSINEAAAMIFKLCEEKIGGL